MPVDRPYIASRRASISCTGSEDEMDVVECQNDEFFSKMSRKIFFLIGEQDPTTNYVQGL